MCIRKPPQIGCEAIRQVEQSNALLYPPSNNALHFSIARCLQAAHSRISLLCQIVEEGKELL